MTRFMMTLEDAVELVLFAFQYGTSGDIFVQKSPAATIQILADAILQLVKSEKSKVEIIAQDMAKNFMKFCLVGKKC